MSTMIEFNGITRSFGKGEGRVDVLKDISLEVNAGELICITGPSGSGKVQCSPLLVPFFLQVVER